MIGHEIFDYSLTVTVCILVIRELLKHINTSSNGISLGLRPPANGSTGKLERIIRMELEHVYTELEPIHDEIRELRKSMERMNENVIRLMERR